MTITAPFRFARINRWVYFPDPDWTAQVSHDLPFADGCCGEIEFILITKTPLLLGGTRKKGSKSDKKSGEVWPFIGPDGRYAIPGSSIQGMIRSILEVASFGKLGPVVAERRFGVRDIQEGPTATELYRSRIVGKVQSGWLVKEDKGVCVFACVGDVGRIPINEIAAKLTSQMINSRLLTTATNAKERLETVTGKGAACDLSKLDTNFNGVDATLVLTGKTQDGLGDKAKKEEFLFHSPCRKQARTGERLEVSEEVWQDFLLIHDQNTGKNALPNPNWEFWKQHFLNGEPVPVFYLGDNKSVSAMGTAQMFKLAMALSTHDLLRNSSKDHLDRERFDLPSLIFGATGEKGGKDSWYANNLKRRASFDMAVGPARTATQEEQTDPETLLAPKPNYYPIYIRQVPETGQKIIDKTPYAAYHIMPGADAAKSKPELAGVKIWPANRRTNFSRRSQNIRDVKQDAFTNFLNLVPTQIDGETIFNCRLRIHNMRPVELGAVLWALTFGDQAALEGRGNRLRHRLGMAKPLGAGEVEIRIVGTNLHPNRAIGDGKVPTPREFVDTFVEHMTAIYTDQKADANWLNSPQVKALLTGAAPDRNSDVPRDYMKLDTPKVQNSSGKSVPGPDSYIGARREGYFMPAYVDAATHEIGVAGPSEYERMVEAAAQAFPGRDKPPTEPAGHPEADAFKVGDKVRNLVNNTDAYIAGFPQFRPHPLEPQKAKWGTVRVSPNGAFIFEAVQQGKLTKI